MYNSFKSTLGIYNTWKKKETEEEEDRATLYTEKTIYRVQLCMLSIM